MICDDCGYCVKRMTEKGRTIICKILGEQLKDYQEQSILDNHCVSWTPKKVKKRRKR